MRLTLLAALAFLATACAAATVYWGLETRRQLTATSEVRAGALAAAAQARRSRGTIDVTYEASMERYGSLQAGRSALQGLIRTCHRALPEDAGAISAPLTRHGEDQLLDESRLNVAHPVTAEKLEAACRQLAAEGTE